MNGLLGVIRMENNDQTAVAIGNDLNSLGLDMGAPEGYVATPNLFFSSVSLLFYFCTDSPGIG